MKNEHEKLPAKSKRTVAALCDSGRAAGNVNGLRHRGLPHILKSQLVIAAVACGLIGFDVRTQVSAQEQAGMVVKSNVPAVTMTTGQGKTMTLTMQTLPDARGYQYCELVFNYGDKGSDIYSTSPLARANLDWWDKLDVETLAKEFGAESVYKNGPQWWSMDEVGVMASAPVPVAGVEMVFGAHLPPGTLKIAKYTVFNPAKFQNLVWKSGRPVYQLVDPDGHVYVLQGHKVPKEALATLGTRFKELPPGWSYRVQVLDEDLVMNLTPKAPIPSVQDEFDQVYIRLPQ